jgi:hypothetical protein
MGVTTPYTLIWLRDAHGTESDAFMRIGWCKIVLTVLRFSWDVRRGMQYALATADAIIKSSGPQARKLVLLPPKAGMNEPPSLHE